MKHSLKIGRIAALAVLSVLFATTVLSCKTSEDNYRMAYEKAREKESAGLDSTVYSRIRREARPVNVVIDGDTVNMRSEYVRVSDGQDLSPSVLKRYNVVVAQFKQLFHARSMKRRMIDGGWPETFIVETREPFYYVIAAASDTASVVAEARDRLAAGSPVSLIDPCPWVLRPSNR